MLERLTLTEAARRVGETRWALTRAVERGEIEQEPASSDNARRQRPGWDMERLTAWARERAESAQRAHAERTAREIEAERARTPLPVMVEPQEAQEPPEVAEVARLRESLAETRGRLAAVEDDRRRADERAERALDRAKDAERRAAAAETRAGVAEALAAQMWDRRRAAWRPWQWLMGG